MYKTDNKYNSNSRPRSKLKQVGSAIPYTSYNRPLNERLEIYENTYKYEPIILQGVDIIIDALLATLGDIEHPDKDIQEFCRNSLKRYSNCYHSSYIEKIREACKVTLWSGFSVTESLLEISEGQIVPKDFITYHPSSLIIRTNKSGLLTENETSYEGPHYKSGIYQTTTTRYHEVQLPMWKVALLTYNKEFNNYYGTSIVESSYRWHVLKEAFVDMMTTTLDRYGNPSTFITVPVGSTNQVRTNPVTGEQIILSVQEHLEEQLKNYDNMKSNNIVLPFTENSNRPQATILAGSNNFGTVYQDAIRYCEEQITRNLKIPFNLLSGFNIDDGQSERQIEMFNRVIISLYQTLVVPFVNQTLHRAVLFNFNREAAKVPPRLPLRKTTRPEARVALMQMIKGLTETGYFNPTNAEDWSSVREMVDALHRDMDKKDEKFVKDILINPRQKPAGSKQTPTGAGKAGRPTGIVTPLQESRPRKREDQ